MCYVFWIVIKFDVTQFSAFWDSETIFFYSEINFIVHPAEAIEHNVRQTIHDVLNE